MADKSLHRLPLTAHWKVGLCDDVAVVAEKEGNQLLQFSVSRGEETWRRELPQGMTRNCTKVINRKTQEILLQERRGDEVTIVLDEHGAEINRVNKRGLLRASLPQHLVYQVDDDGGWHLELHDENNEIKTLRSPGQPWSNYSLLSVCGMTGKVVLGDPDNKTLSIFTESKTQRT